MEYDSCELTVSYLATAPKPSYPMHSKLKAVLVFCLICFIGAGITFRFANLDFKVYSYDEAITSLRISGYSWYEAVSHMSEKPLFTVEELIAQYQSINHHNGVERTVIGLGKEEAQLTPLYFILVRLWAELLGPSITSVRGFSAVLSVALLGAIYKLSRQLFSDKLTVLMVVAISAVSPFLVLYAQDARPYTLLCLTTIISAEALWHACTTVSSGSTASPLKKLYAWGLYLLSIILGIYSHLLFVLVVIAHGLYVALLSIRQRRPQPSWQFGSSLGLLGVAFMPWLWMMQYYREAVTDRVGTKVLTWQTVPETLSSLIRISARSILDTHWSGGILRISDPGIVNSSAQGLAALIILLLIGYSCYRFRVQTPFRVWGIVLLPMGVTLLALLAKGALPERYLMVYFLGLNIAVAYCLADKLHMRHRDGRPGHYKLWLGVTSFVLIAGLFSNAVSAQTPLWSIKYPSSTVANSEVAAVINQAQNPCVLVYQPPDQAAFGKAGQDRFGRMLALSHLLKPNVTVEFVNTPQAAALLPAGFSNYFVYRPVAKVLEALAEQQGYESYPVGEISEEELMFVAHSQGVVQPLMDRPVATVSALPIKGSGL